MWRLGDVLGHSGYHVDGFGSDRLEPKSHLSPRDDDGHGTHTASTAAGNYVVAVVGYATQPGGSVYDGAARRRRPV